MILYVENPEDATSKLLELMKEFGKLEGYNTNIQNSVMFPYTTNQLSEREMKEIIPFTTVSK